MQLLKLFCVGKSFPTKELHTKVTRSKQLHIVGPMFKNLIFIT